MQIRGLICKWVPTPRLGTARAWVSQSNVCVCVHVCVCVCVNRPTRLRSRRAVKRGYASSTTRTRRRTSGRTRRSTMQHKQSPERGRPRARPPRGPPPPPTNAYQFGASPSVTCPRPKWPRTQLDGPTTNQRTPLFSHHPHSWINCGDWPSTGQVCRVSL